MAKDGTNRGGARIGAGRKSKPLSEKIVEGKTKNTGKKSNNSAKNSKKTSEASSHRTVRKYLTAKQKDGTTLCAKRILAEVWDWLKEYGCDQTINPQLVEQYAMSVARWVQCEECISREGLLSQHPTTGADIASPYVTMSQAYMKQVNQAWYQILQFVKENSDMKLKDENPQDNLMEKLLSGR